MILGGSYLLFGVKIYKFEKGILIMGVKVSDIMLDLATGDASIHDAYIQEAMGQVKVSAAIYNAAKQIAMLDDEDRSSIVQECAEAGLPSDKDGAMALVYEAVERELIGTCRHLYSESAKHVELAKKSTAPLKAVKALASACGVKTTDTATKNYVTELANAVVKNDGINLSGGTKFCKAGSAKRIASNLIQGVSLISNAFGIDTNKLFDDETVSTVVPAPVMAKKKNGDDSCTLGYITGTIKAAGKFIKEKDLGESDYTTKITKNDLATVITCNYAVSKVFDFINKKFKEDGSTLEKRVRAAVKRCASKETIAGNADELSSSVVEINADFRTISENAIKAFNDSISSLMSSQN